MGMFDYGIVECSLPDDAATRVHEWQTKDFDEPFMAKYKITAEGRLLAERVHYENLSDPNAPPGSAASYCGCMTPVHDGWDDLNYHGVLNFYGNVGGVYDAEHWYEYNAKFTDGFLVSINRLPPWGTLP